MSYYEQLIHYIDDLIVDKALRTCDGLALHFNDLDILDVYKICYYLIENDHRDTGDALYSGSIIENFLTLLKQDSLENKENLAQAILSNTLDYYKTHIEALLLERCSVISQRLKEENFEFEWEQYA